MTKYEIPKNVLESKNRVLKYKIGDETVYVKKREYNKKHIGHFLQGILYKITRNPMLIPTVLSKNENEVLFEVQKIKELKLNQINVPQILFSNEDYFVMSDTGESLKEYIKFNINKKDLYIEKAVRVLAELHNKNFAHGGSQIRNFTIKNEIISLIDFEEKIPSRYIKDFQRRDLLLFILSLEEAGFSPEIRKICKFYEEVSMNKNIYNELEAFLLKFKWLYFLENPIFKNIKMKDVRDFISIIEKIDGNHIKGEKI